MKIGIVWENGVSKWMSQMFEPLMELPGVDMNVFVGERNKFDVRDVRLRKHGLTHREEILLGVYNAVTFSGLARKSPYRKMHFYLNSLDKYLQGYDIVECHDSSRSLYTLSELKRRKGFKLVVSYAENIPYRQVFDGKTNHIKKSTYEMVDHFIPWCDTIKDVLLLEGVEPEKVTRVYTGVDLSLFRPEPPDSSLRDELGIRAGEFIILYIGKLTSWKGVHMLAYVARALEAKGYGDFRIVVAGRGAQLENLKKLIAEAGVNERFRFAGFIPYDKIRRLYNIADVFVMPSYPTMTWQEQFGMVLVEAMACARCVIGSATGSIPEVIGDAGMTFTPGNFFELAGRIASLMDKRGLVREFGERGRRRAETLFDARKNAAEIYGVYRKVLGMKKGHEGP